MMTDALTLPYLLDDYIFVTIQNPLILTKLSPFFDQSLT